MSSEVMAEYEVSHEKAKVFYPRYERKEELRHQTHFCPGCGHGQAHKMLAKAIDELGIQDKTIMVGPVGCGVFTYNYFDVGNISAAHGRAPAVSTGVKRSCPESIVIDYQGDGDLAAIGSSEILHAANRGEADHGDLHQQRHLLDDRRTIRADHSAGTEERDLAQWKKRGERRLSAARL